MIASTIDPTLPFIDLHRHLEGSIRPGTVLDLARQHNVPLPADDLEGLHPYLVATLPQPGLMAFIAKIDLRITVLANLDACYRIAYEAVEDAAREGIDYLELRLSPAYMARPHQLNPADVVAAVADGTRAGARDFALRVNLIGILSRTYGLDACRQEFEALVEHAEVITALDLAGDEAAWPADLFTDHFQRARDLGWHITAHAGEAAGPESVWLALRNLGAERIGHGLRAREDPALVDYLVEQRIGLEVSLTSNVQISAVSDYVHHPLKNYVDRGVLVALNTDDPAVSNIDLSHEYTHAAQAAGLSPAQIHQIQRNALEMAFLTPEEKAQLLHK
ncbi:MAG: adenosine deaminase [Anaerolineae bacterium]|nr:adenosine deaminase [Anaerolineae bacterium]